MALYLFQSGAANITAATTKIALVANTIKTVMQIKMGATMGCRIIEVNCSFDGTTAAVPGIVEFIEVDVAATVTAFAAADITKYDSDAINNGDPTTAIFSVGTSASGYNSTNEGTPTVVRNIIVPQLIAPTSQFIMQLPLGEEGFINPAKYFRIRMTFPAAVNVICGAKVSI